MQIRILLEHPFSLLVFRWAVGLMFIYASLYKIIDPGEFARSIQNYKIAPYGLTNLMALILPWIEFLSGLFLIIGKCMIRGSTLVISGLLIIFIVAMISAIVRGLDIECGCLSSGGQGSDYDLYFSLFRNVIFLAMCFSIFRSTLFQKHHKEAAQSLVKE